MQSTLLFFLITTTTMPAVSLMAMESAYHNKPQEWTRVLSRRMDDHDKGQSRNRGQYSVGNDINIYERQPIAYNTAGNRVGHEKKTRQWATSVFQGFIRYSPDPKIEVHQFDTYTTEVIASIPASRLTTFFWHLSNSAPFIKQEETEIFLREIARGLLKSKYRKNLEPAIIDYIKQTSKYYLQQSKRSQKRFSLIALNRWLDAIDNRAERDLWREKIYSIPEFFSLINSDDWSESL